MFIYFGVNRIQDDRHSKAIFADAKIATNLSIQQKRNVVVKKKKRKKELVKCVFSNQ